MGKTSLLVGDRTKIMRQNINGDSDDILLL